MGEMRYWMNKINARVNSKFWVEHEINCGNMNKDKEFYVIRRGDKSCGLFSYYIYVLGHLKYALANNWIPIIDMQHYESQYLDNNAMGNKNAWEYYFKQPYNNAYGLNEVYSSRHVILSANESIPDMPNQSMDYFSNKNIQTYWRDLANIHIPLNNNIKNLVDIEYRKLGLEGDTTLGVMLRGTDYTSLKPKGHAIQPDISEAHNMIDYFLGKYSCSRIYIATEDLELFTAITKKYGDLVIRSQARLYQHHVDTFLANLTSTRENDAYLRGIEYIVPMCILARCKYFFGGRTSGSVALPIIGGNFAESILWDSGNY